VTARRRGEALPPKIADQRVLLGRAPAIFLNLAARIEV